MDANDYQKQAARTLIDGPGFELTHREYLILWKSLWLYCEVGGMIERLKKRLFHRHEYSISDKELVNCLDDIRRLSIDFSDELNSDSPMSTVDEIENDKDFMLIWALFGLCGESAEIAGHIYDELIYGTVSNERLNDECGDVSWYISAILTNRGLSLAESLQDNIDKLIKRYPNGYSSKDSQEKADLE